MSSGGRVIATGRYPFWLGLIRPFRDRPDITMPYLWYKAADDAPGLGYPTPFIDRFWDKRENWLGGGVGTVVGSQHVYRGFAPPPILTPIEGDRDAWANGYLFSDYQAGRIPRGSCWPIGVRGGGMGGGMVFLGQRHRGAPSGGEGSGRALLIGAGTPTGGGLGSGRARLVGALTPSGGGVGGGRSALRQTVGTVGGGEGAGLAVLRQTIPTVGGGSGGGSAHLIATLEPTRGGGMGGGSATLSTSGVGGSCPLIVGGGPVTIGFTVSGLVDSADWHLAALNGSATLAWNSTDGVETCFWTSDPFACDASPSGLGVWLVAFFASTGEWIAYLSDDALTTALIEWQGPFSASPTSPTYSYFADMDGGSQSGSSVAVA